ncbi:hypothetical protein [Pandoraea fibrosis]|uniref:OmpA-like domain-containing protein n=1 Tax=Pandoraea fibrosis TaxID=1891094 RepID=A0A5E4R9Z9_9BURK|nr:hypothetical protein [Pandoraea fibrosis]QHE93021.1 hypothetical protein PJ20_015210 [Pandoraea fibrosis]QHF13421.1 hypothetical protein PI93_012790 [Pandoraea fibrosis]VVD59384.1 hypothetical protein PFI31113_00019 [Pandoraea fibrosis]
MAGHGGENNNYWPGFVDALANMIMAMIFMVMIFMILMLHYKLNSGRIVQSALEQQAKAASAASASPSPQSASPPSPPQEAKTPSQESKAEATQKSQDSQALLSPQQPVSASTNVTGVLGDPDPIKADHGDYLGARPGAGKNPPTVTGTGSALRVVYADQGYELDTQAKAKLNSLTMPLKSRPGMHLKVIAAATLGVGYSDSRRLSYYRALGVRNALIEAGWSAAMIDIEIIDHKDTGQSQDVLIQPISPQTAASNGTP